eukprot:SM003965S15206  [mRNA]  locus=s3965:928:1304:+ [translate_table: standard]
MAWEFGCNRSLSSPSQAEFVTYTTYVATQQQVPILVALQCSLKAAIEQPALLPNLTQTPSLHVLAQAAAASSPSTSPASYRGHALPGKLRTEALDGSSLTEARDPLLLQILDM